MPLGYKKINMHARLFETIKFDKINPNIISTSILNTPITTVEFASIVHFETRILFYVDYYVMKTVNFQ